jgi:hypothetical protein
MKVGSKKFEVRIGTVVALSLAAGLAAQQRDSSVASTGSAEIAGVVLSGDPAPQPVRRALVTIAGDLKPSRSAITDDAGRFIFGGLPAGRFTIGARKLTYLPVEYGATRPGRAGSPVVLGAGERRQVTLTMYRGAVITGALRDDTGAPLAGVSVVALDTRVIAANPLPPEPPSTVTDDRGVYRFFGLPPSEYVIAAAPAPPGSGEIGARSSAEIDAIFARLNDRVSRPLTPVGEPGAPPPGPSVGYSPIFFPGTPMFPDASRVRIAAGEEKTGVSFTVPRVNVASIEGMVSGETPSLAAVILAVIPDAPRLSGFPATLGITSVPPNARGEFRYGNLPPGRYRIVARARKGPPDPNAPPPPPPTGMRGGSPPANVTVASIGDMLYGVADVEVRGQDVKGVFIPMQLGGFLSGKLVFDAAQNARPDDVTQFRVGVQQLAGGGLSQSGSTRVGGAINNIPPVNVASDGTFLITGIGPSTYFVTVQVPPNLTAVWKLRSAIVDGRDLLDSNLVGPAIALPNVAVTLSDKRTELSGTLQSASGQPVSDYYVVAFSVDRANWRHGSRRNASARPATNGRFVLADLPAGDYFVAALTDLDPLEWQAAEFLEQVAGAGVKVTIAEGEKKIQDLRIR